MHVVCFSEVPACPPDVQLVEKNDDEGINEDGACIEIWVEEHIEEERCTREGEQCNSQSDGRILGSSLESNGAGLDMRLPQDAGDGITEEVAYKREQESAQPELPSGVQESRIEGQGKGEGSDDQRDRKNETDLQERLTCGKILNVSMTFFKNHLKEVVCANFLFEVTVTVTIVTVLLYI